MRNTETEGVLMDRYVTRQNTGEFTSAQKAKILKRDGYRRVMCGNRIAEGFELYVDMKI